MGVKPWFKVINPREDLREGRPMDASEFAVHLDHVRDGKAPKVYQEPAEFFERTYVTKNLGGLAAEVLRRLNGIQVETNAVFNLSTQFGGGKTHSLLLLYHLAKAGQESLAWKGVASLLKRADVDKNPRSDIAVFVGTEFDSFTGRGGHDGTPVRKTPWGEIAWQLGGPELFALVEEHEKHQTAPGGDVIQRMIPDNQPTLILLDEVMNYVARNRKGGLSTQFYHFLQNLGEVARNKKRTVLAVSIPGSVLEMTAEDQSDFERFKKLLDRLGKPIMMSAEAETSEIIRRRLFEWNGLSKDAKPTIQAYADWVQAHREQLPTWFPVDGAYQAFADTYPFHPLALSVFERKWQVLPRFQQTRGVLRLLALWVSRAFERGYKGGFKDPMIMLGTAPLDDATFRAAVFEQLGEARLEAAVATDIAGRADAHAARLDKSASAAVAKAMLHRKVATTIFFESNGGQQRAEATLPEIRLAVGEPDIDLGSIEQCLEALTEGCYYLNLDKNSYRFGFTPNLNKLLADRRASVPTTRVDEKVREYVIDQFGQAQGIEIVPFPSASGDIPDRAVLTLALMAPDCSISEPGTTSLVDDMARNYGSQSRGFKSAVLWAVADDAGNLREEARKLIAWDDIAREGLKLDDSQQKLLKENSYKAKSHLKESVWQAYKNVFLLDEDNRLRKIDLGRVHSSAAESISALILGRLMQDDLVSARVHPNFLVRNWPPALPEWSTKAVRDAFFASPKFQRLTDAEVVRTTIARGVTEGIFAYVGKAGDKYEPFKFKTSLQPGDVEINDDTFLIRKEDAEPYQAALDEGKQPKRSPLPPEVTSEPPPSRKERKTSEPPPSMRRFSGFSWSGEIPWQKWSTFFTRVISRFSTGGGVKLHVTLTVRPPDGVPEQSLMETTTALEELGCDGEAEVEG